jgi:hypothetical protein
MTPNRFRAPVGVCCALLALLPSSQPDPLPAVAPHPDRKVPGLHLRRKAARYRVKLSNGMVAYLVPDRRRS